MNTYESGNTVVLQGTFFDVSNTKIDPDAIKLKIYDNRYNLIEEIPLDETSKVETGVYKYNYTFENTGAYYYEFFGVTNGNQNLTRYKVDVVFAKGAIY